MRKSILVFIAIFLLVFSSIGFAQEDGFYFQRYLVKSNNGFLKSMFGARHNFHNGFSTELTEGQLRTLEVLGVEFEKIENYQIQGKPSTQTRTCKPINQKPYGVLMVNGSLGGAGVNVAVLDTGVNTKHLDLKISLCKDTTKAGVKNGCSDGNGHGTHVSGTIAANGGSDGLGIFGVAPQANLWMIKVCGNGGQCWWDDIAAGINYASDNGANIISMSLGGEDNILIRDAVNYAFSKGVLVIAAAGNSGPSEGSILYPGAYSNVVAVGAIDANKTVPDWSSRGINDGDYIIEEREVEAAAPGVFVESTWKDGCYNTISGTSMATPHISGLAAKLWQGDAGSTRIYLQNLAKNHDLYTSGDDSATGFGLPISP